MEAAMKTITKTTDVMPSTTDPTTSLSSTTDPFGQDWNANYSGCDSESADYPLEHEEKRKYYDWRKYAPATGILRQIRWLMVGGLAYVKQSDEELNHNIKALARCLVLLRTYESLYGMPERGGPRDQEFVLREVYKDLYAGGTPIWALEPVMIKAAEGLTGRRGVNFLMLPRKTFMCAPASGATSMFSTERGFTMNKLDAMEQVVVRLASFASNTNAVSSVPSRLPDLVELDTAAQGVSSNQGMVCNHADKAALMADILKLGSDAQGLFFFVNTNESLHGSMHSMEDQPLSDDDFWKIESSTCQLFSRLAAIEAMESISKIDAERKELYSPWMIIFFRLCSSAGACAIWFDGSWVDMGVAGVLAILVAYIGTSTVITRQERIVIEVVASFIVGLTAGLIALQWPNQTCFGAMAIAGVLDILQGFRVVYAIIEIMSKHTIAGGADLLEGILFTGLIAYFLKFGQYSAAAIMGESESTAFLQCTNGIDPHWYFFFVPLAAASWSGIFKPNYRDLPLMGFHGVLGYLADWAASRVFESDYVSNFIASMSVTMSAGIISRFTGRQGVGNTVAGIYVLLPGAYLVDALFSSNISSEFFTNIILRAVVIGIGAWTGTMICSPTLLGTTGGLLLALKRPISGPKTGPRHRENTKANAMLFF
jgi:uncharacterized membrane protein YjjP (DUF1212 family)